MTPSPVSSKPWFSVARSFLTRAAREVTVRVKSPGDASVGNPAELDLPGPATVGGVLAATASSDHVLIFGAATWFIDSLTQHGDDLPAHRGHGAQGAVGHLVLAGRA